MPLQQLNKPFLPILTALLAVLAIAAFKASMFDIPKTWDIEAIERAHISPPDTSVEIVFAPEEYYYALPEHIIYKTFPVYAKDYEPPGYKDSLRQLDPEVVFDLSKINTQEDWIQAGKQIFSWPANIAVDHPVFNGSHLDSAYFAASGDPITKDGVYPFAKYVITEKGKIGYGDLSCANCHTRVMSDGTLIIGAQGNHAFDAGFGYLVEKFRFPVEVVNNGIYQLMGTPWYPESRDLSLSRTLEQLIADLYSRPKGVMTRQGVGYQLPVSVPSLIGIKDIKYLDNTGLMRHQTPADLMRYAALNQGMDMLTSYNGFIPLGIDSFTKLPTPEEWDNPFGYDPKRYSDAQLYALTQYIYSLEPPENPYQFPHELIKRGEQIFLEQGCVTCHTPPLFTSNKLTPVDGFEPPQQHLEIHDIFNVSVETDPRTALNTRRGTGYYKIPSLRGVWFKGPFFHNGELATLEDIFDVRRLKDDYVPTGYKPSTVTTQAVKGHDFGLGLSTDDKAALIAFLKTL